MLYTCTINECRCAISNLLSNDLVLGNLLYSDVTLKQNDIFCSPAFLCWRQTIHLEITCLMADVAFINQNFSSFESIWFLPLCFNFLIESPGVAKLKCDDWLVGWQDVYSLLEILICSTYLLLSIPLSIYGSNCLKLLLRLTNCQLFQGTSDSRLHRSCEVLYK